MAVRQYTPKQIARGNQIIKVMSVVHARVLKWSGGRIGGRFLRGAPTGVLHHIGAKSGRPYESPLLVLEEGADLVIVASKGGFPENPAWYHNLLANPECAMYFGGQTTPRRARLAGEEEAASLWPKLDAMYRDFAVYRERAALSSRTVNMFILEPR